MKTNFTIPLAAILCLCVATASAQTAIIQTFDGSSLNEQLGGSVDCAGDVNGDGIPDVIVGARNKFLSNPFTDIPGAALVYSGADGSLLYTFYGTQHEGGSGSSVAGAGDINNDGFDDVIVGAPKHDHLGVMDSGRARVYSGLDGSILFSVGGIAVAQQLGASVDGIGDVDGDGFADFAIGESEHAILGAGSGKVRIYSGASGAVVATLSGDSAGDAFGYSLSAAGDVDGDGVPDLIVGAPYDSNNGTNSGSVTIFSGSTWLSIAAYHGNAMHDIFGTSVSGAGDVDRDGYDDVVVGAPYVSKGAALGGEAQVISGLTGATIYWLTGSVQEGFAGTHVSGVGDINGDGFSDIGVGVPGSVSTSHNTVQIYSGIDGSVLHTLTGSADSRFGLSLAGLGDVNGDGFGDLVVGAPGTDLPVTDAGQAVVIVSPTQSVLNYDGSDSNHGIDLRWLPTGGNASSLTGDLVGVGASASALGFYLAGLASADLAVSGIQLLVAVDSTNILEFGNFAFDGAGSFTASLTRSHPAIAGSQVHIQWFEVGSSIVSSNGIRLNIEP